MKFTTFLPLNDNDGNAFPKSVHNEIIRDFYLEFGGCTQEGPVNGHWMYEGNHYEDISFKITVVCDDSQIEDARQIVKEAGIKLKQIQMYFEYDMNIQVEFLE